MSGILGTHIVDRLEEIFTDSWRRDLRCHKFYIAVGAVIFTHRAAGRIHNVIGIYLANRYHYVGLIGVLGTVITFELKAVASHRATDHVNKGSHFFISGGGRQYRKVRSHSRTLSESNDV